MRKDVMRNFHLPEGRHWLPYINEKHFDANECPPPKSFPNILWKELEEVTLGEKTQGRESYSAAFCLSINHLTEN